MSVVRCHVCLVFASWCFCLFFFFFQAEDGIRDVAVTGVQTCALPILYAAGDVIGDPMFVYVAAYAGALAAENALTGNERRYDLSALPKVTFSDPAVSSVGLTEDEARAQGI